MKKLFLLLLVPLCLSSCYPSYMVADITPASTPQKFNANVYENDTVKIRYELSKDFAVLSFSIYNKLDIPLYIDWKYSALIEHDNKLPYWTDRESTETVSKSSGFYYGGAGGSRGRSYSETYRMERITSIPPHTKTVKTTYKLTNYLKNAKQPINNVEVNTPALFTEENSPLRFRNYLAVSTDAHAETGVFFIDNAFYLSRFAIQGQSPSPEGVGFHYYFTRYYNGDLSYTKNNFR